MPLTVSVSISQSVTNPSTISWSDTSTGSDVAVTKKRIFLQRADGTYLVPAGTTTNYIETTASALDLDVLEEDGALSITTQWLNVSSAVLYETDPSIYCFSLYARQELFNLSKAQAANPKLMGDGEYWLNKVKFFGLVASAENAASVGADIYASQLLLDKAADLIDNEILFF